MRLSPAAPALYALHVDTAAQDGTVSHEVCRNSGFLGVGWGAGSEPLDWASYERRAIERDGRVHAAVREIHDLPLGALIWTRDLTDGVYYLAKVTGPWRYLHGQAAQDCGMQNVRPVRMVACEPAAVPAGIAGCFVGGWVIRRIYDQHAARRSALLFEQLTGELGDRRLTLDEVLTSYLDDRDVRHHVHAYLQQKFSYLLRRPARRLGDAGWEDVLCDSDGGHAVVRARHGWSRVPRDADSFPTHAVDEVFVFSPTGTYGPAPAPNVTELDYHEIVEFMRNHASQLPHKVQQWLSLGLIDASLAAAGSAL